MQLERRNAAVHRRPVILQAGRHLDHLGFDVLRDLQERLRLAFVAEVRRQRAADGDVQRRRAGDAGAGGRLAARRQADAVDAEAMDQPAEQRQRLVVAQLIERQVDHAIGVFRQQLDALVGPRLDPGPARGG